MTPTLYDPDRSCPTCGTYLAEGSHAGELRLRPCPMGPHTFETQQGEDE